jgi:chromosome partitioning protein
MLHTASPVEVSCSVCRREFIPRLAFQTERSDDTTTYFCSLPCRANPGGDAHVTCGVCGTPFELKLATQAVQVKSSRDAGPAIVHVCSDACRTRLSERRPVKVPPLRIAVLNQKGGTGKTTTSVNLAAGIAERGAKVLLIDADPQGNVGVSLGLSSPRTLYNVLIDGTPLEDVTVPLGKNFDIVTSDENLAAAEIKLATRPGQSGLLKAQLDRMTDYTHVIIDCGPSISLMNQNALCAVDEVLIPVACDYLSLVGVKQVLRTIKNVSQHLGHPVVVGGVLPTFYDTRARVCRDSWEALKKHFGDLCLPPIRYNTRLKEAPSRKKTIFEHDPTSHGAEDYRKVVDWLALRREITSSSVSAGQVPS